MVLEPCGRQVGRAGYARHSVKEALLSMRNKVVPRRLTPLDFPGAFFILRLQREDQGYLRASPSNLHSKFQEENENVQQVQG